MAADSEIKSFELTQAGKIYLAMLVVALLLVIIFTNWFTAILFLMVFSVGLFHVVVNTLNFHGLEFQFGEGNERIQSGQGHKFTINVTNSKPFSTFGLTYFMHMDDPATDPFQGIMDEEYIEPKGETTILEAYGLPAGPGWTTVHLDAIKSGFPFRFYRRRIEIKDVSQKLLVWVPRIPYFPGHEFSFYTSPDLIKTLPGIEKRKKANNRLDAMVMGDTNPADSPTGVSMMKDESEEFGCWTLVVECTNLDWDKERIKKMISLAATLSEDLFKTESLRAVVINNEFFPVNNKQQLIDVLDQLTLTQVEQINANPSAEPQPWRLAFTPYGRKGVSAITTDEEICAYAF